MDLLMEPAGRSPQPGKIRFQSWHPGHGYL